MIMLIKSLKCFSDNISTCEKPYEQFSYSQCRPPCPSRLARLRAPPTRSVLSSAFSSFCEDSTSWEENFSADMEFRALLLGEKRFSGCVTETNYGHGPKWTENMIM